MEVPLVALVAVPLDSFSLFFGTVFCSLHDAFDYEGVLVRYRQRAFGSLLTPPRHVTAHALFISIPKQDLDFR